MGPLGGVPCRAWVERWWATAAAHLDQPAGEVAAYEAALAGRFANTRMHDRLARIAEDGSQKLPVRVLHVLRAERAAGRLPVRAARRPTVARAQLVWRSKSMPTLTWVVENPASVKVTVPRVMLPFIVSVFA